MDETIEILSEKVANSISDYSLVDQAHILQEVAIKLGELAQGRLVSEYGVYDDNDN